MIALRRGGRWSRSPSRPPRRSPRSLPLARSGLALAAINGPASTVFSGRARGARGAGRRLRGDGNQSAPDPGRLRLPLAPRSSAIEAELLEAIADVKPRQAEIPILSTLTGEPIAGTELNPDYWYRNLREPVRFDEASATLIAEGHTAFLEISPHPVLTLALTRKPSRPSRGPLAGSRSCTACEERKATTARFLTSLGQAHGEGDRGRPRLPDQGTAPSGPRFPPTPSSASATGSRPAASPGDAAAPRPGRRRPPAARRRRSTTSPARALTLTGRISLHDPPLARRPRRRRQRPAARHRLRSSWRCGPASRSGRATRGADPGGAADPPRAGRGRAAGERLLPRQTQEARRELEIHSRPEAGGSEDERGRPGPATRSGTPQPQGDAARWARAPRCLAARREPSRSTPRPSTTASPTRASNTAPPSRA